MGKRVLWLVCMAVAGLVTAGLSQAESAEKNLDIKENGVLFQAGDSRLELSVFSDNIIRVRRLPAGADIEPHSKSLAVISEPAETFWRIKKNERSVDIVTAAMIARISLRTGKVSFHSRDGTLLAEESGYSLKKAKVAGVQTHTCSQKFSVNKDEHFYGLGEWRKLVPGKDVRLQQQNTRTCVPVLCSNRGWGIFWDNASITDVKFKSESVSWSSEFGSGIDYYFIRGEQLDDVIAEYRSLTGKAPMLPRWGYGLWFSRNKYNTQQEVLNAAKTFRRKRIPVDLIIQDYFYWSEGTWGHHDFDPERYPDPPEMIRKLHDEYNMNFMAVVWPKFDPEIEHGKELKAVDGLLPPGALTEDQWDWAGNYQYYDPFNPRARDIFWNQVNEKLFSLGLDAWWIDGAEPEIEKTYHGADTAIGKAAGVYNAFPLMHTTTFYQGQRKSGSDKRVVLLPRSGWAGQQRNSVVCWSGDIYGDWETLKWQIRAGQNFCMSGIPYWTTDIGGYNAPYGEEKYKEVFIRWLQWGSFCPVYRIHGNGQPHPWQMGTEVERNVKKYTRLRYRLLPYIYSLAHRVTGEGYTIMRPLAMDFPEDKKALESMKNFMFGSALFVAPVTEPLSDGGSEEKIPAERLIDTRGEPGGLTGRYFNGENFQREVVTRTDREIAFKGQSPVEGLNKEYFSVRWEGKICSGQAGEYVFVTRADDGVRLWVDGELLIDDWNVHPVQTNRGTIKLDADKRYDIKLEYFQNIEQAEMSLKWITPVQSETKEEKNKTVNNYLPEGYTWYDFWTGQRYSDGGRVDKRIDLDTMPLYVRAGSILPMGPELQYAGEKSADPVELRVYPGADGFFTLYEDEGDGYAYEKGVYSVIPLIWDDEKGILTIGQRRGKFPGMQKKRTFNIVIVEPGKGDGISVSKQPDLTIRYTGQAQKLEIKP